MKKTILLLIVMLLGAVSASFAQNNIDLLYLKSGSIIRGQVLEQIPNKTVKIQMYDGSIYVYNMSHVLKIVKDTSRKKLPATKSSKYDDTFVENDRYPKRNNSHSLKGYKGFIESGYSFGDEERFEFNTSHGYQFNNYLFLGGGVGLHYYPNGISSYDECTLVPIFVNFRANFINKKITPFADVKSGYSVGDFEGFYASAGIGARFTLARKMALSIMVSYSYQEYEDYYYDYYDYETYYTDGIGVKIGFEF